MFNYQKVNFLNGGKLFENQLSHSYIKVFFNLSLIKIIKMILRYMIFISDNFFTNTLNKFALEELYLNIHNFHLNFTSSHLLGSNYLYCWNVHADGCQKCLANQKFNYKMVKVPVYCKSIHTHQWKLYFSANMPNNNAVKFHFCVKVYILVFFFAILSYTH